MIKLNLEDLREIAWTLWDPIELCIPGTDWKYEKNRPFWDEYDTYLIYAQRLLLRGMPDEEVVSYFEEVEIDNMGLGRVADTQARASKVVEAMKKKMTEQVA